MSPAQESVAIVGFLPPESAVGDYEAVAYFRAGGQRLLVTASVTLAAIVTGRAGHPIDWMDYPPLAALGYQRIEELLADGLTASEIPLTAEDADDLLAIDRVWWAGREAERQKGGMAER
jgi:hypothetical protein